MTTADDGRQTADGGQETEGGAWGWRLGMVWGSTDV
jgi:hypothetical protein